MTLEMAEMMPHHFLDPVHEVAHQCVVLALREPPAATAVVVSE
jgi:hypothetical protein